MKKVLFLSLLISSCGPETQTDIPVTLVSYSISDTTDNAEDTVWKVTKEYVMSEPSPNFIYIIEWKKYDSVISYYADSRSRDTFLPIALYSVLITDGKNDIGLNFSGYETPVKMPSFTQDVSDVNIAKIVSISIGDHVCPHDYFNENRRHWLFDTDNSLDSILWIVFPKQMGKR
ncbi:MAG: hypothetical protein JNL72_14810 [Flavipsychrobacter sp.]|nr:hypothetical protein [Flavipsychrobacter sp.]